jgi:hypothetical protein
MTATRTASKPTSPSVGTTSTQGRDEALREFRARVAEEPIRPPDLAAFLDALGHEERVAAIRSAGRADQRRLYEAVKDFAPLRLTDLVAPAVGEFVPVRHFGKNTLPAFTHFEKRLCRPRGADPGDPGELYGFNFQSLAFLTGPGYFVAVEDPSRPEVWVDYRRVPPDHPEGWPEIRSNEGIPARFVYGYMVDTLRRVSEHVTIGSAARNGRDLGSWFLLCREA